MAENSWLSDLRYMQDYCGGIDGSNYYSNKPFIVVGWPTKKILRSFDTAEEAASFIYDICTDSENQSRVRLYGFVNGEWMQLAAV
jgi:hypothetical protein